MSKKDKLSSNKSIIETTRIIFLASCTLIFIFTIFIAAIANSKPKKEKTKNTNTEKCVISGCNGEVCQGKEEEPTMTICLYNPEYDCYKKAICEVQEDGSCGWTETEEYQECINNLSR